MKLITLLKYNLNADLNSSQTAGYMFFTFCFESYKQNDVSIYYFPFFISFIFFTILFFYHWVFSFQWVHENSNFSILNLNLKKVFLFAFFVFASVSEIKKRSRKVFAKFIFCCWFFGSEDSTFIRNHSSLRGWYCTYCLTFNQSMCILHLNQQKRDS